MAVLKIFQREIEKKSASLQVIPVCVVAVFVIRLYKSNSIGLQKHLIFKFLFFFLPFSVQWLYGTQLIP